MRKGTVYVIAAGLALALGGSAGAQQPGPKPEAGAASPGVTQPTDRPGTDGGALSPQMMQMCRQMMGQGGPMGGHAGAMGGGGMMGHHTGPMAGMAGHHPGGRGGGGMMGMMPMMMGGDPKQQAEMMAMRGEMMRAMGDIMVKYAERMRQAK